MRDENTTPDELEQEAQPETTQETQSEESGDSGVEQQEATDWQDKYLRLYAEFDNFRKRTMRERGDLIRNAGMDVLEKMLPVLDDFDRAASNQSEDVKVVLEGQGLIHNKLKLMESRENL